MPKTLLHKGSHTTLSLEEHKTFGSVVVKSLNEEFPAPKSIKNFLHEYEVGKDLNLHGTRQVLGWEKVEQQYRIVLKHVDAITLDEYQSTKPSLRDTLKVFSSLAKSLAELHENGVIHHRITPSNILVETGRLNVKIIDLAGSTTYSMKSSHMGNLTHLDGAVEYMAPEQTGRMNRLIDHRSDLYSVGIMFYQFLTGTVPFKHNDILELVHAHIAMEPQAAHTLNPDVPEMISQISDKLLKKNADQRYQSASGLRKDLEHCLLQLSKTKSIPPFELAQEDISPRFNISQRLYGRENELDSIMNTFDLAADGQTHLMLVSGYSGTGKSALVSEIYKPITGKKGYFIEGKFDQYQRAIPYYAIVQAFDSLIHELLTEPMAKLNRFKTDMLGVLGAEGKVLTDVMPALELLIGKQPDVAEINGEDAQNRFNYIFQKWLSVVCSERHPVVLFIDDLQWADSASLDLLKALMVESENHFMCICAYRDNEVSSAHPFSIAVDALREQGTRISNVHLENLRLKDIKSLLADSLQTQPENVAPLATLIQEKTQGNAFFVVQFIRSLADKKLLRVNGLLRKWEWDLDEIKNLNITDNVVEFMANKIQELPSQNQELFKAAACLGTVFNARGLSHATSMEEEAIADELELLLTEGLIIQQEDDFKFAHDRIQQAVYSMIGDQERKTLHYQIGKRLLEEGDKEAIDEQLFEVVNHLNWGLEFISSEDEKSRLAHLNLLASQKAKLTSAFDEAFDYISFAISLLPEQPWQSDYELTLSIYEEAAESSFLAGQFSEMRTFTSEILDHAQTLMAKVKPYEILINAYKAENKLKEALNTGLEIMDQLGESFPKKPSMLTVFPDLIKTALMLRGKKLDDILALPKAQNEIDIATVRILANIAPSAYWGNPTIFPHIIFRMCQISLKKGVSAASAFGFATYGVIMIGVLNMIKVGYPYGEIGLELIRKFNAKEWVAQVYTPVFALNHIWNRHIKHTLSPLLDSYHVGLETGALEFACINANIYCIHAYVIGKPLDKLEPEIADYSHIIQQYKQETNHMYNEVFRQSALNFMGRAEGDVLKLVGEAFDEEALIEDGIEEKNRTITFQIYLHRSILANYFGKADYAYENSTKSEPILDAVLGKIEVALQSFHYGLAAAYATNAPKNKAKSALNKAIKKMKHWAANAPENFEHKLRLLQAEKARNNGDYNAARDLYDEAIQGASVHEYIQEEALANELAGKFHMNRGNSTLAGFYLKNAFQKYRDWGAHAKLDQLSRDFPEVLRGMGDALQESNDSADVLREQRLNALDLQSVFKVSTALSGEVVFEKMLDQLMRFMSENIGAENASVILPINGQLTLAAKWKVGQDEMNLVNVPLEETKALPKTVINYIHRTQSQVFLANASSHPIHGKDPYIQEHSVKSVLGLPLLTKGELQGILYLENNLVEHAFHEENVEFLNLLSSQIAVSIDNAMLYENLEKMVAERTSELEEEKKKSDDLLLNILPAETALELKKFGRATPRKYESVSVLFTDFVNFTSKTEQMSTESLVVEVDTYFSKFDEITSKYNIEKIKTIGDAYLCVSGLPHADEDHALNAAKAAIEMRDFVRQESERKGADTPGAFEVRIGIHSGPVVSGVVGTNKFAFDIWGDTVNTASRMETHSESSRINISGSTYELIKDHFECEYRGKVPAKSKGEIDMYYIQQTK